MKKIVIQIAILLGLTSNLFAQQPVSYNLYPYNQFLLNPSAMGENNCLNAFINRQNKWTDLNNAPTVSTFGVHGKIGKNSTLGGMLASDNRALVSYLTANLMYAHYIKLNSKSHLSLGLSAGLANNSLNTDRVNTKDINDPAFQVFNSNKFDVGFGASYYFKQWKAGLSFPHIFDQFGAFSNQYNVNVGYDYTTKNNVWKITPMALLRNYKEVGPLVDLMATATWSEKVSAQLGYRTDKSLIAGIGFNWNILTLNYAYQYHTGDVYNTFSASGTQEIQLSVRICRKTDKPVENKAAEVDKNADKVNVNVNMTDEKYGNPVMGNITILKGNNLVYSGKGDASGISSFYLLPGVYQMSVTAKGYIPVEETIDISKNEKGSRFEVKLKQPKIEKGLVFKLSAINFETGSDKLTAASYNILDKMADILKENPQMVVEVGGHTDNVGDDQKNLVLSQNRANAVMNYSVKKGVKASQLKAVGFGETQPISDNDTDEGRKKNRRVMFTVLEF